jgi:polar amino acid transport system permease protein
LRVYMKRSTLFDIVKFLVVITAAAWLFNRGAGQISYTWQWYQVPQYLFQIQEGSVVFGPLLTGLMVTFHITAWAMVFTMILGLVTALLRLSDTFVSRSIARGYLETVRNTPLLVQIFFIYFVLAPVLDLDRFYAAVIALSLFEGAYASEIFRAGIVSIHRGQWEASYSLGLNTLESYRHIILPQAIRRIIPPLTNQAISLIKDSALVSTIAVYDLTMQGRTIIAETFLTFEIWFTIAAIYLVITVTLSFLVSIMESRLKIET